MLAVHLSYMAFFMLRYVPFMSTLGSALIINAYWILSKTFLYHDDVVLFFILTIWYINWFTNFEKSLLPWDRSHLIAVHYLFNGLGWGVDLVCSSTLAWKIPWTEEPGAGYCPRGGKESDTTEQLHFLWLATILLSVFNLCSSVILACNFHFCDIFFWFLAWEWW